MTPPSPILSSQNKPFTRHPAESLRPRLLYLNQKAIPMSSHAAALHLDLAAHKEALLYPRYPYFRRPRRPKSHRDATPTAALDSLPPLPPTRRELNHETHPNLRNPLPSKALCVIKRFRCSPCPPSRPSGFARTKPLYDFLMLVSSTPPHHSANLKRFAVHAPKGVAAPLDSEEPSSKGLDIPATHGRARCKDKLVPTRTCGKGAFE